jgi:uncharacterized iron-regulated membrane protein
VKSRDWFRVHSWVGIFGGLLLFVLCWSGTVATFSDEIDWLLNPVLRAERGSAPPASWGRIHEAVQRAFPDATVEWLQAPPHDGFAVQGVVRTPQSQLLRVYVHPSTAEVQGSTTYFNVQRFFRSFHMLLFLPYPPGTYVVGAFGVLLAVSTLTPLVFYKRWWTRFLELRTGRGRLALWSGLHKLTGLWSLWFGVLIAITGIWYLVEQASIDIAGAEFAYPPLPEWRVPPGNQHLPIDVLAERTSHIRPDLDVRSIHFVRDDRSQGVLFTGQAGHILVRDFANQLYFDPVDGTVIRDQAASDLGPLLRWVDTADPLHFGDFAGWLSQTIWFVFGLMLSALCLTGAYLHAARLIRESNSRRAYWPGTAAAVTVALFVLVGSFFGGWGDIRKYGALVDGARAWPQTPSTVIVFIAAWIAVTLSALWMWVRLILLTRRQTLSTTSQQQSETLSSA